MAEMLVSAYCKIEKKTLNSIQDIFKSIKEGQFSPIYFLMGEEPYFIDLIEKELYQTVLSEEERAFNQTILYGKDTTIEQIVDAAKRFPMMAEFQLVIVREAQELSRVIHQLESYVANPQPSTILVVCYKYKSLDKRKKLYKSLQGQSILFESKSFMKIRCQIGYNDGPRPKKNHQSEGIASFGRMFGNSSKCDRAVVGEVDSTC